MTQRVVNYTYGTGNPVIPDGSIDVRDGIDNLQSLDVFMNAPDDTYNQRDGDVVRTLAGMNNEFDAQIMNMGFTRVGTFAAGATLTNPRQTLLWDIADGGDGQEYGWSGALPKVVPATSTPSSTGGISVGAWISRFDPELRIQVREALRRSYAEAGYNLVDGSFEAGGTLVNTNDVLLQERTGKAFSGPAGAVAAGTNPASGGFADISNTVLTQVAAAYGLNVSDGCLWSSGGTIPTGHWRYYGGRVWRSNSPGAVCGVSPDFLNFRYIESDGSVTPYGCGALGDGVAIDTDAFQRWLQSPELLKKCLHGSLKIGAHTVRSNSEIHFAPVVELLDSGTLGELEDSITIQEVENVTIYGNNVKLSQLGQYTTGEQRHGIVIGKSAKNIKVYDLMPEECGGDGVYVGTQPADDAFPPTDIELTNVKSRKNRRQGLSVTNVDGLTINGGAYKETGRGLSGSTFPISGIDFEPNSSTAVLKRIVVNDVDCRNPIQCALEFNLAKLDSSSEPVDIAINHPRLDDAGFGLKFATCPENVRGHITIKNPVMDKARWCFISMGNWAASGVKCLVEHPRLTEINYPNSTSNQLSARGCIKIHSTAAYDVGGLTVTDIHMSDSQYVAQLFSFISEGTGGFANISLLDQDMTQIDATAKVQNLAPISPSLTGPRPLTTRFRKLRELPTSASQDSLSGMEVGALMTNRGVSGNTIVRLSSALTKGVIGPRLCFLNVTGGRMEIVIEPALSGTFKPVSYSPVSTKRLISQAAGDYVEIYTDGSDNWYIDKIVGLWNGT